MMSILFSYPLPNNGNRYDLSQEELIELLQKVYDSGAQSMPAYTYSWVGPICPRCIGTSVYPTVTAMNGPGNKVTYHCSNCGHSWEVR